MQKTEINSEVFCCRWSPTLGALEDTHQNVWDTKEYQPYSLTLGGIDLAHNDREKPTVFFGIYGLPDFMALWGHKGKKYILWAGSDIQHFLRGYFLDPEGKIRIHPTQIAPWIDSYCESYVENEVEKAALASVGVRAKVVPSFLGKVTDYPLSYEHAETPKLYTSVSGNNWELYGWDKIPELAILNPDIDFHLYGNTKEYPYAMSNNVIVHGRVPQAQMNEEIKEMQGALRLTEFDGFSEILAKSVLMGQWPVSVIEYPCILKLEEIGKLHGLVEPNVAGREYYQKTLNRFPWNKNYE